MISGNRKMIFRIRPRESLNMMERQQSRMIKMKKQIQRISSIEKVQLMRHMQVKRTLLRLKMGKKLENHRYPQMTPTLAVGQKNKRTSMIMTTKTPRKTNCRATMMMRMQVGLRKVKTRSLQKIPLMNTMLNTKASLRMRMSLILQKETCPTVTTMQPKM
ncbi:hypothetical protein CPB86DRAFT_382828 [Serendipita vermifera]|nr:hypothetical protein CPB86DRAFT_382828 [Serendipita vermifera]